MRYQFLTLAYCIAAGRLGAQLGRAPLDQVGDLRVEARDRKELVGVPPRLLLTIATIRGFPCPEHEFRYTSIRKADTLILRIDSVISLGGICPDEIMPVVLQVPLGMNDAPRAVIIANGDSAADSLQIAVTAQSVQLKGLTHRFVHADTTHWLRYPENSMMVACASVPHAAAFCEDALRWIDQQKGLRRITFPRAGVVPFIPEGIGPDFRVLYYRYSDTSVVRKLSACLLAVQQRLASEVGVSLGFGTWTSLGVTAYSPRWISQNEVGVFPSPEPMVTKTCRPK